MGCLSCAEHDFSSGEALNRYQFLFLVLPMALVGADTGVADWYRVEEILLM